MLNSLYRVLSVGLKYWFLLLAAVLALCLTLGTAPAASAGFQAAICPIPVALSALSERPFIASA